MTLLPVSSVDADVVVIGSGFAGSLTSLCLRRRGRRVVLVERGRHPRFAIGESSTPLANLLLEELADRYELPRVRVFSKWGTWQQARPDVAAGLKRGFTFFMHNPGERFPEDVDHERQLLVAASPHDRIGDTHWYRPDVDQAFVAEAVEEGTEYFDETELDGIREQPAGVILDGTRHGRAVRFRASFVVDASGPRGFLHRALGLGNAPLRWLPPTQGLYTHFESVDRWTSLHPTEAPPYPPDDAAVHHVFPGGWIWVLRFNNGITSAGAALTDSAAALLIRGADPAGCVESWDRLLARVPSVGEQFRGARPVRPFVFAPRLAFRSRIVHGGRWALLPSAAGVIDPLLSTGFPLTLLGIGRLLDVLETTRVGDARDAALAAYSQSTLDELDATERLVGAMYATMSDPPLFKRLALLYFAAASYSEAAHRLGRPALAPGFLLHGDRRFGPELAALTAMAMGAPQGAARESLFTRIDRAIEPIDVAGLLDRTRRDWYPVLAADLIAAAPKLSASTGEVCRLLERSGFDRAQASPDPVSGRPAAYP